MLAIQHSLRCVRQNGDMYTLTSQLIMLMRRMWRQCGLTGGAVCSAEMRHAKPGGSVGTGSSCCWLDSREEAPLLFAVSNAHQLVLPAAHDGIVILLRKLSDEVCTALLSDLQLLLQRGLKLQQAQFSVFSKLALLLSCPGLSSPTRCHTHQTYPSMLLCTAAELSRQQEETRLAGHSYAVVIRGGSSYPPAMCSPRP